MDTRFDNSPSPAAPAKVVLFDLWKTIARGPYPEPIADFRTMLGLDGLVDDEHFLRRCLTTPFDDPREYLVAVASHYGVLNVPEHVLGEFESLIRKEKQGLLTYTDVFKNLFALKQRGYRLGLVTNSWPFPVRCLLDSTGLDELFEHVISSSEVGVAKQDGPDIYIIAAQYFGVLPEEVVMVGDNPSLDVLPVLAANARAVLIDRDETYVDHDMNWRNTDFGRICQGVKVIRSLDQLLDALS